MIQASRGKRTPRPRRAVQRAVLLGLLLTVLGAGPARAGDGMPPLLREVGIDQRLGQQVPLDLVFRDETGAPVRLGGYVGVRPAILVLAYYECPMLCTEVLNGVSRSLRMVSLRPGRDFSVVVVSINPRETPALAAAKKATYVRRYEHSVSPAALADTEAGWHFLTGAGPEIATLARAVGFRYAYDPAIGQYAHASGIMVLTPQGRVSQYLLGIEYPPRQVRLALVEASSGKIGTLMDRLLLFCYHYDPIRGRNGPLVIGTVRLGGLLTMGLLFGFIGRHLRRDLRRRGAAAPGGR